MKAQRTDMIYWRIVPVGFATVFLSAQLLTGILLFWVGYPGETDRFFENLGFAAAIGLVAIAFFGGIVWLPAMVVWNVAVFRLRRKLGLRTAAVATSVVMAGIICLFITLMTWTGETEVALVCFFWSVGTTVLAGVLTGLAFSRSRIEVAA